MRTGRVCIREPLILRSINVAHSGQSEGKPSKTFISLLPLCFSVSIVGQTSICIFHSCKCKRFILVNHPPSRDFIYRLRFFAQLLEYFIKILCKKSDWESDTHHLKTGSTQPSTTFKSNVKIGCPNQKSWSCYLGPGKKALMSVCALAERSKALLERENKRKPKDQRFAPPEQS